MNRIKDYSCFAACFGGLGYIAMWPLTADEGGGTLGGSMFCRGNGPEWLGFLCQSAQPLYLPPGLHALGFIAAMFVTTRALVCVVKRSRRRAPPPPIDLALPDVPVPPLRKPGRPLPEIKPRTHFGLRNVPRLSR